jgi:hypothetical protein
MRANWRFTTGRMSGATVSLTWLVTNYMGIVRVSITEARGSVYLESYQRKGKTVAEPSQPVSVALFKPCRVVTARGL